MQRRAGACNGAPARRLTAVSAGKARAACGVMAWRRAVARRSPSSIGFYFSLRLRRLCSGLCPDPSKPLPPRPSTPRAMPRLAMMHPPAPLFCAVARTSARAAAPRAARTLHASHIPAPATRLLHSAPTRPSPVLSRARLPRAVRFESSATAPAASTTAPASRLERDQVPSYELTFTCNVCTTRSSHRLSKQGYHHGTVLISCPDCKNRHLISDHLKARRPSLSTQRWELTRTRYSQTSLSPSKTSCARREASSKRVPWAQTGMSSSGTMAAPRLGLHNSIPSRSPKATTASPSSQHHQRLHRTSRVDL